MKYEKMTYNKGKISISTDDLQPITKLAIDSLRRHGGKQAVYQNDQSGIDAFIADSINYFEWLRDANESREEQKQLYPSVEGLAVYCGTTRKTLAEYEKRSDAWSQAVGSVKAAILACKTELSNHGRIPPLIAVFDYCNNFGFVNTSEFRLVAAESRTATQAPRIDSEQLEQIATNGGTDTAELLSLPQLPTE